MGDFNAHSTLWHCKDSNIRGVLLERFILENALTLANTPQTLPTFDGAVGHSNIDLTLSRLADFHVQNWRVVDDICSSDHNLLIFDLISHRLSSIPAITSNRLFFSKSSWKKIAIAIRNLSFSLSNAADVSSLIKDVSLIATNNSSSRTNINSRKIFWTPDLIKLRSQVRHFRYAFARHRDPATLSAFRKSRNAYCAALRKAKLSAWLDLISSCTSAWGPAYRYNFKRSQRGLASISDAALCPLSNSLASLSVAAVNQTLDNLFPNDLKSLDNELQSSLRHSFVSSPTISQPQFSDLPISSSEVTTAIKSMRPRKATGPDGVPLAFLKFTHIVNPSVLQRLYRVIQMFSALIKI